MKLSRLLLFIFLIIVLVILGGTWVTSKVSGETALIDLLSQPTIGDPQAKIHLVVFEELQSQHSRQFHLEIFPQIQQQYIDTKQIMYTVIPVATNPSSMLGAISLLCVYNQDPGFPNADLFMQYLNQLFKNDWEDKEEIVRIAEKTSRAIDLERLGNCIDQIAYETQVETNLRLGKQLQGETFVIPSIYVNGKRVKEVNFEAIRKAIEASAT